MVTSDLFKRVRHGDVAGIEVNIGPLEAKQLALPHAGIERHCVQGAKAILGRGGEQPMALLQVKGMNVLLDDFR